MLTLLSLTLAVFAPHATPAGPCDLLSRDAAGQLLGQAVATVTPNGPEPDEETGGTRTTCVYQAGNRMLIVIRVGFADAAAAREATTAEGVSDRLSEEGFTVVAEPGLGDAAYWAETSQGAGEIMALKGSRVLALALGGMPRPAASYRAQLRATMVTLLASAP